MSDGKYDKIIDLPHPTSKRHPRMSVSDRAAQFAPFSALSGYEDAIDETGRLTDGFADMSDDQRNVLDMKQRIIADFIDLSPRISVTYFVADKHKSGGAYRIVEGELSKIDEYEAVLIFSNGFKIKCADIYSIDGDIFNAFFES